MKQKINKGIVLMVWILALWISSMPILAAPDEEYDLRLVSSSSQLDLTACALNIVPGEGPCVGVGNKIFVIDSTGRGLMDVIALHDSVYTIDDFIVAGKNVVVKSGASVIWTDGDTYDGMTMEDDKFDLRSAGDSTIYLVRRNTNEAFEFSMADRSPVSHLISDEKIVNIFKLGSMLIMVTEYNIMLSEDGKWKLLHSHPFEILSADINGRGLYFGTDEGLWLLIGKDEIELIGEGMVKRVMSDGERLYILDGENNLYSL